MSAEHEFVEDADGSHAILFPERLDDFVHEENPLRVVDTCVEGLDLSALGFGTVDQAVSRRPGYHSASMLKIYEYLKSIRSSCRLERETHAGTRMNVSLEICYVALSANKMGSSILGNRKYPMSKKNKSHFFTFNQINLLAALATLTAVSVHAQRPVMNDWRISDFFSTLPESFITTTGDFAKPSAENIVFDENNGYAATYMNSPEPGSDYQPFPTFQMALFKSEIKLPLIVISNTKNDHVCTDYETFFLRYDDRTWTEVGREALPTLNLDMFWDRPHSAAKLLEIIKESAVSYHFEPPRRGTRMKVSLEICDFLEDDASQIMSDELRKLMETAKPIYLEWSKTSGEFKFKK